MLYTICAIVRRRLEQENNPERRETIIEMLDLLESPENLNIAQANSKFDSRDFSLSDVDGQIPASSGFVLSPGLF